MRTRILATALLTIVGVGCTTAPVKPPSPTGVSQVAPGTESSVDIQYVLGRNHHRLWIRAERGAVRINSYVDHEVVDEKSVEPSRYKDFLKRASEFVQSPRAPAHEASPCRAAFTVQVQIGDQVKTQTGCRSSDEGALSHLVRDGEILLVESDG